MVDAGAFSEELAELDGDTAFALYQLGSYGLVRENLLEYMFRNASWWERLLSIAGGLLLIYPGIVTDAIGLALVGLVVVIQLLEKRHDKKMASV